MTTPMTPANLSSLADPAHDEKEATDKQTHRFRDLISGVRSRNLAPAISPGPQKARSPRPDADARPGTLCKNKIGEESCWTVVVNQRWQDMLRIQVYDLIEAQNQNLYKRDRREFNFYMEIFLVGRTLEDARLAMVISCNSETDLVRLQKLLKKFQHVPEFDHVSLLAMYGGPRNTVPLIPLSKPIDLNQDAPDGQQEAIVGSIVYGVLDQDQTLTVPTEIWIGQSLEKSHKAVLGGLLSVEPKGAKLGMTVAHASFANTSTPIKVKSLNVSAIGMIASASKTPRTPGPSDHFLDWALIKFDAGIRFQSAAEPPHSVDDGPSEPAIVQILAPRGSIRGVLSPSATYISLQGIQCLSPVHAVMLDAPIKAGDSGIWAVGSDGRLYGHVAFGHDSDTIAYIIPAYDTLRDIEQKYCDSRKVEPARLDKISQYKVVDGSNRKKTVQDHVEEFWQE